MSMLDTRIKPSWWKRSAPILVTAAVLGLGYGTLTISRGCARRAEDERVARGRAADERDGAIATTIRARLAPLRDAPLAGAPATCPANVTGRIELVEQAWLGWLLGDRDYAKQPEGPSLRTRGFGYLTGSLTPSWDEPDSANERNQRYLALASAPFIAVLSASARPVAGSGSTFEGGTVDGELAIADVAAGRYVCAVHVASAAKFVISVRQSSASAEASARAHAEREALEAAFRETATAELGRMAPAATLAD